MRIICKGEKQVQKYVLIISQYYYSHIMKICYVPKDFEDKAKMLIEDLEQYKRNHFQIQKTHYGDFSEGLKTFVKRNLSSRYGRLNVNDVSGDIYFILSNSLERIVEDLLEYQQRMTKEEIHAGSKIRSCVSKHHDLYEVIKIIEKHFDVAR